MRDRHLLGLCFSGIGKEAGGQICLTAMSVLHSLCQLLIYFLTCHIFLSNPKKTGSLVF